MLSRTPRTKSVVHRPEPILGDPIFFHKSELKLRKVLINVGRLEPGTRWRVVDIVTHTLNSNGNLKREHVKVCQRLKDDVHLERIDGVAEQRTCSFATLSYSAIWRMESV